MYIFPKFTICSPPPGFKNRTSAIISRGLYTSYSIFEDHINEVFSENSLLMYGWYSRTVYDGAYTVDTHCITWNI